jgi:hypothetical protein
MPVDGDFAPLEKKCSLSDLLRKLDFSKKLSPTLHSNVESSLYYFDFFGVNFTFFCVINT